MATRLGIDATQRTASCAVSIDREIIVASTMEKPVENFTTLIRETLIQADVSLDEVDEIVACIGPGSQMGIRTTVVTGNALALALGLPITGVLSTDSLAVSSPYRAFQNIAVAAGKTRWYVSTYNWSDSRLERIDGIRLLDEPPSSDHPTFRSDSSFNCAKGILTVVEQQGHLITQPYVDEIIPYEWRKPDGK